jgi:hypothetical protein
MLLLVALDRSPTPSGQSNFVADRNKVLRRVCFCKSMTMQPLKRSFSRVQPFADGLMHKQHPHRLRYKLHASSDQIEQSTPNVELSSLRPDVLQVLPGAVDLDLRLQGEMLERGVLDTSILSSVDNPLGSLWLSTEKPVDEYMARQLAREHYPNLVHDSANTLVLRLRTFCSDFTRTYVRDNSKPAHLDFYVLASSSVKVGCCTFSAWRDLH